MINKPINFIKYIPFYFGLSAVVIGVGVAALAVWGLRPAVDFVGGSLAVIKISSREGLEASETTIRQALSSIEVEAHTIQTARLQLGSDGGQAGENSWLIRTSASGEGLDGKIKDVIGEQIGEAEVERFESVGPTLGRELLIKTLAAILIASGGILIYVAYRFGGSKYGICADLAMVHDSLVLVGSFAVLGKLFGIEVDTLFVTAVLTILSFSVHDTIVVYDRIRENLRRFPQMKYDGVVNLSINETLGRSINNSLTIIFMLTALLVLGGETTRPFILALLVGTITGTYSSTFTAAPLLVVWNRMKKRKSSS
jgi:preprotein translocase subunit SecF